MSLPVKRSKHVEDKESVDCLDRISILPDELLGHVLSFLPTKGAVNTSILSKRWRNLYTLMDSLYFDDRQYDLVGYVITNEETLEARKIRFKKFKQARKIRFKKFVYNVLKLHQVSPIKKFSLVCVDRYDESDLDAWVSAAVEKGVDDLHCYVSKQMGVLPDELFLCESLVRLKLIFYEDYELKVPSSARLTSLRILYLEDVMFPDYESLERLFSICKLLEEFTLKCCTSDTDRHAILRTNLLKVLTIEDCEFHDGSFEIDAPNLARLSYSSNTGVKIVPSWKDSSSLVRADLLFDWHRDDGGNDITVQYDRELVKFAAYKVTTLHLLFHSPELLLTREHQEMPNFHCLTRLHLHKFPHYVWKCLTSLLDKSPELETIIFELGLHRCCRDPESPSNATLSPFSCNAKVIEVHYFCEHKPSLLRLGHLLRNAGSLQKLIVHKFHDTMEEKLRLRKDLLMLPRASRDCCIELI